MFKTVYRVMESINRFAAVLMATLLGLATAAVLMQIIVRFALPRFGIILSAPWTEESARFLMTWSVFIGAALLCRRGALIAVTALPSALPARLARWIGVASTLCTALFFAVLLVVGWQWSASAMSEAATVLRIPMGLVYAAMPLGAVLSLINLGLYLHDLFGDSEETPSKPAAAVD